MSLIPCSPTRCPVSSEIQFRHGGAEAAIVEAQAKREHLKVAQELVGVAQGLDSFFSKRFPRLGATERSKLISRYLAAPTENLSHPLLEHGTTASVKDSSED